MSETERRKAAEQWFNKDENHAVVGRCKRIEVGMPDAQEVDKWKWEATIEFDPNPKGVKLCDLKHILFLIPGPYRRRMHERA